MTRRGPDHKRLFHKSGGIGDSSVIVRRADASKGVFAQTRQLDRSTGGRGRSVIVAIGSEKVFHDLLHAASIRGGHVTGGEGVVGAGDYRGGFSQGVVQVERYRFDFKY